MLATPDTLNLQLLLPVSSPNESNPVWYATVRLTPEYCQLLLMRVERLQQLKRIESQDLIEMYYWSSAPTWYGTNTFRDIPDAVADRWSDLTDRFDDWLEREPLQGLLLLDGDHQLPEECECRVEISQLVVRDDEVCWTGSPKHTDYYVTTNSVPVGLLHNLLHHDPCKWLTTP